MEKNQIKADIRKETGKGVARKLRRSGLIPGVVYGKERDSQPIIINPIELRNKLFGNAVFNLIISDGNKEEEENVIIKEAQRDPIKGTLLHVDFQSISMSEKINVTVHLSLTGDAPGVKNGGVLQQNISDIEIECLAKDIPGEISVDISNLDFGHTILVSDLNLPDNISLITPLDEAVVTITAAAEFNGDEDKEDDITEPEVIGEKENKIEK